MYIVGEDKVARGADAQTSVLSLCVEFTTDCPGRCPHCLVEEFMPDASMEQVLRHLDILAEKGVQRITWGGGEPLLRHDTYRLGKETRCRRIGSLLATSGGQSVDFALCHDAFDWIDLSLDSISSEVFRVARPGISLDAVQANVKGAVHHGLRVRTNILLTQLSLLTLRETVEWIAAVGVKYLRLQPLVPRGRARHNWDALCIQNVDEVKHTEECMEYARSLGLKVARAATVKGGALAVLKPNGYLYAGNPHGLDVIGPIQESGVFERLQRRIGSAQERHYATTI